MNTLWPLFLNNNDRIIDKFRHYFPVYERHFSKFVGRPVLFIEIGCGQGGSLQLWKRYLGPYARIVGIDINPKCMRYEENQISVRIGNQSDPAFLQALLDEFGSPDAVLDDGSHVMDDVAASFRVLYPNVQREGVYLVEDLHTAYDARFGGGLRLEGTFIEQCKAMIDALYADHIRGWSEPKDFAHSTMSIHFYHLMAVFEKGQVGKKSGITSGRPTAELERKSLNTEA